MTAVLWVGGVNFLSLHATTVTETSLYVSPLQAKPPSQLRQVSPKTNRRKQYCDYYEIIEIIRNLCSKEIYV
jgi:hypothetical protein